MTIFSWNVAGLRARLKPDETHSNSLMTALFSQVSENGLGYKYFDIVCLQETKCTENEVTLPCEIEIRYPYRFWNSTDGTSQRKGLSGTTIWCASPPIRALPTPEFDVEGRIVAVEFEKFILVNVYVPNSQKLDSDRFKFREQWNAKFMVYISDFQKDGKQVIVCGDMNVAHLDIDISNPKSKKNKVAGFFDFERVDFAFMTESLNLIDVFRTLNPMKQRSTYWSNFMKGRRRSDNGWGIDYFLVSKELFESDKNINQSIENEILGSDHCPIILNITV
jgi:exodeoxyribonuclease III